MNESVDLRPYRRFLLWTIGAVCLLILVGGIVRSTGSGMGCPDWPKCFGQWVPPTEISQLPGDYKETYSAKRHEKNLRMASYVELLGMGDLAEQLRNDKSILEEENFNATKTWIEYLNRLLGAVIGLLIFANIWFAFKVRKVRSRLLLLAILNFVLVGFQGWVGSVVVSTNLLPGLITFHMLLALLILAVLIYNYWLCIVKAESQEPAEGTDKAYNWLLVALVLFTVQVAFGTQVREGIDSIAKALGQGQRDSWVEQVGLVFYIHRSYSIIILATHLYVAYLLIKLASDLYFKRLIIALGGLLVIEILSGTIMAYFAIPAILQPVHLLLATLIFGIDFYLLLEVGALRKGLVSAGINFRHIL